MNSKLAIGLSSMEVTLTPKAMGWWFWSTPDALRVGTLAGLLYWMVVYCMWGSIRTPDPSICWHVINMLMMDPKNIGQNANIFGVNLTLFLADFPTETCFWLLATLTVEWFLSEDRLAPLPFIGPVLFMKVLDTKTQDSLCTSFKTMALFHWIAGIPNLVLLTFMANMPHVLIMSSQDSVMQMVLQNMSRCYQMQNLWLRNLLAIFPCFVVCPFSGFRERVTDSFHSRFEIDRTVTRPGRPNIRHGMTLCRPPQTWLRSVIPRWLTQTLIRFRLCITCLHLQSLELLTPLVSTTALLSHQITVLYWTNGNILRLLVVWLLVLIQLTCVLGFNVGFI